MLKPQIRWTRILISMKERQQRYAVPSVLAQATVYESGEIWNHLKFIEIIRLLANDIMKQES